MSGKVWLVTSGEYSDYGVEGAFTTEDDAYAAIALGYGGRDTDVQEFVLHGPGEMPAKSVVWAAHQRISEGDVSASSSEQWNVDRSQLNRPDVQMWSNLKDGQVICRSTSRERAIKIVSDRVAKLRAEREGL